MARKKKATRRTRKASKRTRSKQASNEAYLIVVRSWMLVVMFALMLGIGAILGNYLNTNLNPTQTHVAGAADVR